VAGNMVKLSKSGWGESGTDKIKFAEVVITTAGEEILIFFFFTGLYFIT